MIIKMIAKVTVVTGLHRVTKEPISVGPGVAFHVRNEAEAEHLVGIGAAEYATPPAPAEASGEGGDA